jgi:hypothetical protein
MLNHHGLQWRVLPTRSARRDSRLLKPLWGQKLYRGFESLSPPSNGLDRHTHLNAIAPEYQNNSSFLQIVNAREDGLPNGAVAQTPYASYLRHP